MLNILVEKALEKQIKKTQLRQPMFTISYSSINPKSQDSNLSNLKSKTVNKIPKLIRKDQNIFLKWKSKTLQKLKDINIEPNTSFFPAKLPKNHTFNQRTIDQIVQDEVRKQKKETQIKKQFKLQISPIVVNKKKLNTKIYSFQQKAETKKTKSEVKDEKIRIKRNPVIKNLEVRRTNQTLKNHVKAIHTLALRQEKEQNETENLNEHKNMGFINTIQYKTVPKQQINFYKRDKSQQARKHTLEKIQNIFIRNNNQNKPGSSLMNYTITILPSGSHRQIQTNQEKNPTNSQYLMRKIYTEKGYRKNVKENERNSQFRKVYNSFNNYRPWSPVKTNPLYINEDDLLFQKSNTFDITSRLEVPEQNQ